MQSKTERIAKNTLMLYFRHILTMFVGFYTIRIKLDILGVEDYGIYNIVGGVVVLFSFLNAAMTNTTQRFLNFAMGQEDKEQLKNVYSMSYIIHILIAIVIFILAETIGLWFFLNIINIPPERQSAAFIVYQFSLLAAIIKILMIPNRATIVAHEKMSYFALISIVEVLLSLSIVLLLLFINYDKLITYSFLVVVVALIIFILQKIYCNIMFETARFRFCKDKLLFKQLTGFSGWNLFYEFSRSSYNKGTNILLNVFHGILVNASMGIAKQVDAAVYSFVNNFQTAFRPQIVKSYAANDFSYFFKLIFRSSKVSFSLLLLFVLPLYININFVLTLWLKTVPDYTVIFLQLMLINSFQAALFAPLTTAISATGNIKKFQLVLSFFEVLNLPVSLLFLYFGFNPASVLIIKISLDIITLIWRIFYTNKMVNLPIIGYLREVIFPVTIITVISCLVTVFISVFFNNWSKLLITGSVSTICIVTLFYLFGLNKNEKLMAVDFLKKKLKKNDN